MVSYKLQVAQMFLEKGIEVRDDEYFEKILDLVKDRCTLLTDFWDHSYFFFKAPVEWDVAAVKPKWNEAKAGFFATYTKSLSGISSWDAATLETVFKQLAEQSGIKPGELQLPLRVMLVGGKFGPPVFDIAAVLGKEETIGRIEAALNAF